LQMIAHRGGFDTFLDKSGQVPGPSSAVKIREATSSHPSMPGLL
jgi:hypothetical protein